MDSTKPQHPPKHGGAMSDFVLFVVLVFVLSHYLFSAQWGHRLWYGARYDHLHYINKPADCNFFFAPIGEKDCHYEANKNVVTIRKDASTNKFFCSEKGTETDCTASSSDRDIGSNVYISWDKKNGD